MVSVSVLKNLTNFTITDRSNNETSINEENSNPTTSILYNTTPICEEDHRSEATQIAGDDDNDRNIQHNNKKLKISKDNDTNKTTAVYTSQVWKYAEHCQNSNYSICLLCSDNKKISTNNGSTSTLCKHLISKHQVQKLILSDNKRKRIILPMHSKKCQQLDELFIKCILLDGRTFNDLQKAGMKNVLQQIIPS